MDRKKQSLKTGVVGLNEAEQRQVRGGQGGLRLFRYSLAYGSKRPARQQMLWQSPYYRGYWSVR